MIRYENVPPTPEDYNRLRRDAGWPEMDAEAAGRCLPNSSFAVCAFHGNEGFTTRPTEALGAGMPRFWAMEAE